MSLSGAIHASKSGFRWLILLGIALWATQAYITFRWLNTSWDNYQTMVEVGRLENTLRQNTAIFKPAARYPDKLYQITGKMLALNKEYEIDQLILILQFTWRLSSLPAPKEIILPQTGRSVLSQQLLENVLTPLVMNLPEPRLVNALERVKPPQTSIGRKTAITHLLVNVNTLIETRIQTYQERYYTQLQSDSALGLGLLLLSAGLLYGVTRRLLWWQQALDYVLSHMGDAILLCNPQGRILLANDAAQTLFKRNLVGQKVRSVLHVKESLNQLWLAIQTKIQTVPFVTQAIHSKKTHVPVHVWLERTTSLCSSGWMVRLRAINTNRAQPDASLVHPKPITAALAHEIRTPLGALSATVEQLATTSLRPHQQESLKLIQSALITLQKTIEDFLSASKLAAGKLQLNPQETLSHGFIQQLFALNRDITQQKTLAFELEIDNDIAPIWIIDAFRLQQILQNLINNAIKFTPKGRVVLRVRVLKTEPTQQILSFTVEDTGVGLLPEQLSTLFQPFEQAHADHQRNGTGLGLFWSQTLAMLMEGNIQLTSQYGKGSCATLTLTVPWKPLSSADLTVPSKPVSATTHTKALGNEKTLLLLEDQANNRTLITQQLKALGYTVHSVETGAQALDAYSGHHYGLLIMDWHLPDMAGADLVQHIRVTEQQRASPSRLPIIVYSGNTQDEAHPSHQKADIDDWLTKPASSLELHATIQKWLAPGTQATTGIIPPFFDPETIQAHTDGDLQKTIALFNAFQSSSQEDIALLQQATQNSDRAALQQAAHRVKSSSAMVGLKAISLGAADLEHVIQHDNAPFDDVLSTLTSRLADLATWLATHSST